MLQTKRIRIDINGRVQGVGFRPTVFRYAKERGLSGWVSNTSQGVIIEVEGGSRSIDDFLNNLRSSPPPQAEIQDVKISPLSLQNERQFKILPSIISEEIKTQISPDIATCQECLQELLDPEDRRYLYPFLNCTNCGPRFTIVKGIPYDRNNTTMEKFTMCPHCQAEYEAPENRRFHAQPNACPECGPQVELIHNIKLLNEGKIIAIKGLGGFHLACDALNEKAVKTLRKRKYREDKPFALMAKDLDTIKNFCYVSDEEEKLLVSAKRPIVLLRKRDIPSPSAGPLPMGERVRVRGIAPSVAPNNKYLGFMLPYTPLHHLLFFKRETSNEKRVTVLVMTSGNISDEPIAYRNEEAISRLAGIADYFLIHNRDIHTRCDDSVTRIFPPLQRELLIRRSRGYVPQPITVPFNFKEECLACGAHLKNTFALAKDSEVYISHHIGDLENWETLSAFQKGIEHFKNLFNIEPKIIAHDMHPEYLSTKYALALEQKTVAIQHHHAHIVSCMADNGLNNRKVIGVAFDGTGYGEDGCIWGGEFLVTDFNGYQRKAHLDYIPLPGGEQAIKEPWRMAAAYLYKAYGKEFTSLGLNFIHRLDTNKWKVIEKMITQRINSPLTSSMGRLFDAVSSLLGVKDKINYEGQAAVELEMTGVSPYSCHPERKRGISSYYDYRIKKENQAYIINTIPVIQGIVEDLQRNTSTSTISGKFHFTVAEMIIDICKLIALENGLTEVALSGGVFQNIILLTRAYNRLTEEGFRVYVHHKVPPNDGGISLGQAVIANEKL